MNFFHLTIFLLRIIIFIFQFPGNVLLLHSTGWSHLLLDKNIHYYLSAITQLIWHGWNFISGRYLLRHRKEVHDKHNKSMTIIRDNISYMYRDEKNEDHPCPNCGKIFNSFKGKIGHLANCGVYGALGVDLPQVSKDSTVPNNSSVLCDVCGKEFQNNRKMKLHKKRHSQEYREKKKAENKKYRKLKVCPRCGKVVMNLQGHLLTHSDLKFQCEYCEKKCYRMDALQSHMRVHTGERPFSCYLCGQAFKQHGDMNKHILNVHKEEPIRVRPRPSQLGQEINS